MMRRAYQWVAWLIAGLVAVQAAMVAYFGSGESKYIGGGVIDRAMVESGPVRTSKSASAYHFTTPALWTLRLAGLSALVNGAGFGAFDIPAIWHLARVGTVWHALGNPTYGHSRFEAHGFAVSVPVLVAFLGTCLVLAIGGVLLMIPRSIGVAFTLAGIVMCAPFWWGFNLPYAWLNAATIVLHLASAWAMQTSARPRPGDLHG